MSDQGLTERQRVGQQMSFALYGATSRVIRMYRPFLDPLGLTYPQYLVLLCLFETAPRSVGDIGATLGMENGSLTPLLKRLTTAGLISRQRDTDDERRVIIDFTAAGRALWADLSPIPDQIKSACNLSDEDMAAINTTLNSLAQPPTE